MTESRGNWEPERGILGWARQPAERTCRFCRRSIMHTQAEHDEMYPVDLLAQMEHDRDETERQVDADRKILRDLIAGGMTEDQAVDELWRIASRGEGLVERKPRP